MKTTREVVLLLVLVGAVVSYGHAAPPQNPAISDKDMVLLDYEDLSYPGLALQARIRGVVVVSVELNDKGQVVNATAISGAESLVPDCLANARKWRFRPNARKAAVIVYRFSLVDWITKSGCSHFMLEPPNFATITGCAREVNF